MPPKTGIVNLFKLTEPTVRALEPAPDGPGFP
jgi:hypothetical protein